MSRFLIPLALLGCAAMSEDGLNAPMSDTSWTTSSETSATTTNTSPPPEVEDDPFLLAPAQTDVYVFVANPERDTITRIQVLTQQVDTLPVGVRPEIVHTTQDYSTAVVFNAGDDTLSIIDAVSLDTVTVPIRDNFNDMRLSPDGQWAVLWHNINRPDDVGEVNGALQSFNEASFVNINTGEHSPMAVGFNPRRVVFTPDGRLAVIVSDAYLAIIDLTKNVLSPTLIELEPELVDPPSAEEVILSPSGKYAFIRQFGADHLKIVNLEERTVANLPVGAGPTDLDLSPDGTEAVVVARDAQELWVLSTETPFAPAVVLSLPNPDESMGSLLFDPTGRKAVIYTTASPSNRYVSWDRLTNQMRERTLVKPVSHMAITPTGNSMMVFHTKDDTGVDALSPFLGEWALTMISLDDFRSNPLLLPAETTGYANSTNGDLGFFIMKDEPYLEVLDYQTLLHEEIPLRSNPVFVGVLPDLNPADSSQPPAWVSQEHPLGRISFFTDDDGVLETITGFELNSQIETE